MAKPNCVFQLVGEADHLLDLPGVGRRLEDERAEVAVQAVEEPVAAAGDPLDGVQGLARFEIEAEPRPLGIDAGVEVQPQPDRELAAELARRSSSRSQISSR